MKSARMAVEISGEVPENAVSDKVETAMPSVAG